MAYTPETEKPTLPEQNVKFPENLVDTGAQDHEIPSELEAYVQKVAQPTSQSVTNNNGQVVFAPTGGPSSILQVPVSEEEITGKQKLRVENSEHWFIAGWRRLVAKALFAGTKVLYPTHGWGIA